MKFILSTSFNSPLSPYPFSVIITGGLPYSFFKLFKVFLNPSGTAYKMVLVIYTFEKHKLDLDNLTTSHGAKGDLKNDSCTDVAYSASGL